jgi:hypothetical protein
MGDMAVITVTIGESLVEKMKQIGDMRDMVAINPLAKNGYLDFSKSIYSIYLEESNHGKYE